MPFHSVGDIGSLCADALLNFTVIISDRLGRKKNHCVFKTE